MSSRVHRRGHGRTREKFGAGERTTSSGHCGPHLLHSRTRHWWVPMEFFWGDTLTTLTAPRSQLPPSTPHSLSSFCLCAMRTPKAHSPCPPSFLRSSCLLSAHLFLPSILCVFCFGAGIPVDGMPAGHADGNPFYPGAPITAGMETGAQGGGAGRHQQQQYYPQFPSGAAQFNIPGRVALLPHPLTARTRVDAFGCLPPAPPTCVAPMSEHLTRSLPTLATTSERMR